MNDQRRIRRALGLTYRLNNIASTAAAQRVT
jgi:hypothetical protein